MVPSNPVGSGQAELGSGLVEGTVVGSCTYTDAVLHACFIQSRPQVQSIVTLEYRACVCACVYL